MNDTVDCAGAGVELAKAVGEVECHQRCRGHSACQFPTGIPVRPVCQDSGQFLYPRIVPDQQKGPCRAGLPPDDLGNPAGFRQIQGLEIAGFDVGRRSRARDRV